jgi:transcriptional regulator with XRE-family HTH domain
MDAAWFGPRLRELRAAAGLTQKALAKRAGLTREAVACLETGRNDPRWKTVLALCSVLGVTTDDFLKPPGEANSTAISRPSPSAAPPTQRRSAAGASRLPSIPSRPRTSAPTPRNSSNPCYSYTGRPR